MKRALFVVSVSLLAVMLLLACAPAKTPSPTTQATAPGAAAPKPAPVSPAAAPKAEWQTKWDQILTGAKAEGVVTVYSTAGPDPRVAVTNAFKKEYGLRIEVVGGKSSDLTEKALRERRGGLFLVDIFMSGNTTITPLKTGGALDPLEPAFVLPEVTDPKMWWGGRFPWIDKEHLYMSTFAEPEASIAINTNLVKTGEIKSFRDLLDPKWKGKTLFRDMSVPGGAAKWFAFMLQSGIYTEAEMRQLAAQKGSLVRDSRLQAEWMAQGKYAVGVAMDGQVLEPMLKLGVPIKKFIAEEGTYLSSDSACIAILSKQPHPNAAKLFVNWFASKAGQTVYTKSVGSPSRRVDVTTEHLDPRQVPQPNMKYFDYDNEEVLLKEVDYRKLAKEIFDIQ